jgi:DNA-binding transcriptional LysR family regulator
MNDRFFSLQLFVRVARVASFSIAGREMGISQPTASRIVAALERKVGASLLTRTTRGVTLTEAGTDYLLRAEEILAALDEADHAARGTGELRGLLRIALSTSFAVRTVIPRIHRFSDRHPELKVEFIMNDEKQDLVSEAVDVALRVGALSDTSAVARKIGTVQRVLSASPSYLARAGTPKIPADLSDHSIIVGPAGRGMEGWAFKKCGKTISIRVDGRFILNGAEGASAAATAGLGIVNSSLLSVLREIEAGDLVRVLPDWEMSPADVHAIVPAGRAAKPSARAFVDFIHNDMRGDL